MRTGPSAGPMRGAIARALAAAGVVLGGALALACSTMRAGVDIAAPGESRLDATHPLVGVIWDVDRRRPVTEEELAGRVRASELVLVGETHDNPDHHRLEARLLRAFAERHATPAVVFEMIERDQQPAVDAALRAHPGDADGVAEAVHWATSGWPAWSMYRPVFEAAVAAKARILGGGLGRGTAMRIARDGPGAFDPALEKTFGLGEPLPTDAQAALEREMSDAHCGLLPQEMLGAMGLVQRTRDALLAERLHDGAADGHGALLVAGDGHVRRDRGVPSDLTRAYGAKSLAIGLLEVRAGRAVPEAYAEGFDARALPFDYVWFTPRANDVDHCAELRARGNAHPAPRP